MERMLGSLTGGLRLWKEEGAPPAAPAPLKAEGGRAAFAVGGAGTMDFEDATRLCDGREGQRAETLACHELP